MKLDYAATPPKKKKSEYTVFVLGFRDSGAQHAEVIEFDSSPRRTQQRISAEIYRLNLSQSVGTRVYGNRLFLIRKDK